MDRCTKDRVPIIGVPTITENIENIYLTTFLPFICEYHVEFRRANSHSGGKGALGTGKSLAVERFRDQKLSLLKECLLKESDQTYKMARLIRRPGRHKNGSKEAF